MKTQTKQVATKTTKVVVFSFWKDNKVSGFFQLTDKELSAKFKVWLLTKDKEWLAYYGINDCINNFVSVELNAIGNTENNFWEYDSMRDLLAPIRNSYLY